MHTAYQVLAAYFLRASSGLRYGSAAVLSCLLLCFSACSRQDEPLPVAAPASVVATSAAGAKAQAWFASQKSAATGWKSSTASRTVGDTPTAIDWERAIYSEEYIVAPFC